MAIDLSSKKHNKKALNVFSLVMINVIAVDSLRSLPINAEYGFSIVFYYAIAALLFFIPVALVAAELSTTWPKLGGMYIWVREAFGKRWGLIAIWLQWIYNVVWYPTILSFIAATLAYLINPHLISNTTYMLSTILIAFWGATFVNCFGIKISSWIAIFGAIVGTLIPMLLITLLGLIWLIKGNPIQIHFSWHSFLPHFHTIDHFAFLIAVLFGLIGMEMSAIHASDVENPQKGYPKALAYSTVIILSTLLLASLAIAIVIPHHHLSLLSGLIDAYGIFFKALHMQWMMPIIAISIIIGAISSVSAWLIGPSRGLLVAIQDESLPAIFGYTNKYGAPVTILFIQAILFTCLCSAFILMPSVISSYWILSAMTAQLAMIVYLFMFSSAIKLRYKFPAKARPFKIPGRRKAMWVVSSMGFFTCIVAIIIGFLPPPNIKINNLLYYELTLILGIVFFCTVPLLLHYCYTKRRNNANE